MFEKEAEEYANKYVTEGVDELKIKVIKGHWQDGAEFGYNEKYSEFEKELKWERDTKAELAEHLGKANDRVADLEDKLANADYQIEGRDLKIKDLEETIDKLREQFALRYNLEDKIKDLESQIEKLKSDVISERDHSLKVEDIITYTVLNDILDKWEVKEND
jgi:chromosome segregation ATPase